MKTQKIIPRIGAALCLICLSTNGLAFDPADPIPEKIAKGSIAIELEQIASGVISPNYLTHAGDGSNRLFVVQQPGQIGIIENGGLLATPFLDVSSRLPDIGLFGALDFDERGLLGLAFHPDFANNGKLYTFTSENATQAANFTVPDLPPLIPEPGETDPRRHQSVVAEWRVDQTDPNKVDTSTRREILRIDNPQFNHNGGAINFGHDNQLYIAVGDGGNRDDNGPGHGATGNGQNPGNVLGTILRIDIDSAPTENGQYAIPDDNPFVLDAGRPDEIFAFGLRNAFRFSFDSQTGSLIAADVGQGDIEEVNIVTAGGNYGWNAKEGSFKFIFDGNGASSVSDDLTGVPLGLIDPVLEYDHDEGISIIGGFVYRGSAIPELVGKYVFGDFSTSFGVPGGRLFYGDLETGLIQEFLLGLDDRALGLFIKGFGEDAHGEIYLLADAALGANSELGEVLKLVAAPVPVPAAVWFFVSGLGLVGATRRHASSSAA